MNNARSLYSKYQCGLIYGFVCSWLLVLSGCGRPDTATERTDQSPKLQAVADATTPALEVRPQAAATSAAYPVLSTQIQAVPDTSSVLLQAPELGVVLDEQNRIVAVLKGGTADNAGVQIDDTLMALDTLPLAKGRDIVKQYLSDKPEGTAMRLTVIRTGQEQQVRITSKVTPTAVVKAYLDTHPDLPPMYYYL